MTKHILQAWWKYVLALALVLLAYHYLLPELSPIIREKMTLFVQEKSEQDAVLDDQLLNQKTIHNMDEYTQTESGLQYKIITKGEGGDRPESASAQVTVHYHGTLTDGTVFDSSRQRGETISFALNQVITGWTEGLQLMEVGDTFEFHIPAVLAYGDHSPSPLIPAGSDLIFEVELFEVHN